MQNDNELVGVNRDDGITQQWARKLFYRKEGGKEVFRSESTKALIFVMFCATLFVSFFRDESPQSIQEALFSDTKVEVQNQKIVFTDHDDLKKIAQRSKYKKRTYQRLKMISRKGSHLIPPGSMVKAKLVTGGSNGPLKAKLIEPLIVNGDKFLDAGTVLLGTGSSTEERLLIQFNKMVFKDSSFTETRASGYDSKDKILGLKGSRVGRVALKFAANTGLKFLGGVSQGLQKSEVHGGINVKKPSLENALLHGAGMAALEQSNEMMADLKERQTIIEVPLGTHLWVVFGGQ